MVDNQNSLDNLAASHSGSDAADQPIIIDGASSGQDLNAEQKLKLLVARHNDELARIWCDPVAVENAARADGLYPNYEFLRTGNFVKSWLGFQPVESVVANAKSQ